MARPEKDIDAKRVEQLASRMCTQEEIAADQDCSTDTLQRRFAASIKAGHEKAKLSLRAKQFELAMGRPAQAAVYLRANQNEDGTQHGELVLDKETGKPILIKKEQDEKPPVVSLLIFLGKQYLKQADRMKFDAEGEGFEFI